MVKYELSDGRLLGEPMTTYHDVPADLLINELSARLVNVSSINPPEWSKIVKTVHIERGPLRKKIGGISDPPPY